MIAGARSSSSWSKSRDNRAGHWRDARPAVRRYYRRTVTASRITPAGRPFGRGEDEQGGVGGGGGVVLFSRAIRRRRPAVAVTARQPSRGEQVGRRPTACRRAYALLLLLYTRSGVRVCVRRARPGEGVGQWWLRRRDRTGAPHSFNRRPVLGHTHTHTRAW